ncbi:MAG: response regulator [Bacteroidota bacterium]|jgi:DNA-binding NtrC family response regulator
MNPKVILVLDDEKNLVLLLIKELEKAGFKVYGLESKSIGISWLREHHADVNITDINSPFMDGLQFLKALKADPDIADTPVIFWSGNANRETVLEAKRLGAFYFILKPSGLSEILASVRNAIGGIP